MPQPYDYSLNLPNPTAGFLQGIQLVEMMQQQKAAREQSELRQGVLRNLMALGDKATAKDYVQASLALPDDAAMFKQSWDTLDEAKRNAIFKGGSEAYMLANDPEAAVARLEEYAAGFENSGDDEAARTFRDAAQVVKADPAAARTAIGMMLAFADGERFEKVAQTGEATTFQKDFQFIKETFGEDAAAEFAQFGRGGVVSIPLGNGQTYVGPASLAPGSARWQAQERAEVAEPRSAPEILQDAAEAQTITQAEANVIRQSLGANGQKAFDDWRAKNKIKIIVRTGRDANGRPVVQYDDGTVDYAD